MNWKEQLRKEFYKRYEGILQDELIEQGYLWYADYISTEIIEKLIEDIPDENKMIKENKEYPIGGWISVSTKQQLKSKWLAE